MSSPLKNPNNSGAPQLLIDYYSPVIRTLAHTEQAADALQKWINTERVAIVLDLSKLEEFQREQKRLNDNVGKLFQHTTDMTLQRLAPDFSGRVLR